MALFYTDLLLVIFSSIPNVSMILVVRKGCLNRNSFLSSFLNIYAQVFIRGTLVCEYKFLWAFLETINEVIRDAFAF